MRLKFTFVILAIFTLVNCANAALTLDKGFDLKNYSATTTNFLSLCSEEIYVSNVQDSADIDGFIANQLIKEITCRFDTYGYDISGRTAVKVLPKDLFIYEQERFDSTVDIGKAKTEEANLNPDVNQINDEIGSYQKSITLQSQIAMVPPPATILLAGIGTSFASYMRRRKPFTS